jgi:hypothetical protein
MSNSSRPINPHSKRHCEGGTTEAICFNGRLLRCARNDGENNRFVGAIIRQLKQTATDTMHFIPVLLFLTHPKTDKPVFPPLYTGRAKQSIADATG